MPNRLRIVTVELAGTLSFALMLLASCSDTGPECDPCSIAVDTTALLGDVEGAGILPSAIVDVSTDPGGRHFVAVSGLDGQLLVYDSSGKYLTTYGRSGRGPGEFVHPQPPLAWRDAESLVISDPGAGRITIVRERLDTVLRMHELPFGILLNRAIYPDIGYMVVNAVSYTDRAIGLPLHLLDNNGVAIRSFGADPPVATDWDSGAMSRKIALSHDGTVWSAHRDRYMVERWDTTGVLADSFHRNVEWFPPTKYRIPTSPHDEPPTAYTSGIWEDRSRRVWVAVRIPAPDWTTQFEPAADTRRGYKWLEAADPLYHTRIEVFDPHTWTLLAHTTVPLGLTLRGDGTAFSAVLDDGIPRVVVWRLSL